jgi:hypothetical protein
MMILAFSRRISRLSVFDRKSAAASIRERSDTRFPSLREGK